MTPTREGALHIFRFSRINVFVHWSWFVVAIYFVQTRAGQYDEKIWALFDYLALFVIVTMHEFGHALACRSVGGYPGDIVLWPLGGVAYVSPPHRAGAHLWSIAAGPLVNLVLVPVFLVLNYLVRANGLEFTHPDLASLIGNVALTNTVLLIFNMMPIFPLDGGQILRALLWFKLGFHRATRIATSIGFVGCACFGALAIWTENVWLGVMAFWAFMNCRTAWLQSRSSF